MNGTLVACTEAAKQNNRARAPGTVRIVAAGPCADGSQRVRRYALSRCRWHGDGRSFRPRCLYTQECCATACVMEVRTACSQPSGSCVHGREGVTPQVLLKGHMSPNRRCGWPRRWVASTLAQWPAVAGVPPNRLVTSRACTTLYCTAAQTTLTADPGLRGHNFRWQTRTRSMATLASRTPEYARDHA